MKITIYPHDAVFGDKEGGLIKISELKAKLKADRNMLSGNLRRIQFNSMEEAYEMQGEIKRIDNLLAAIDTEGK